MAAVDEPVSGAVTAIATSPTNADLVYIGTANGGVWKTTNATAASPAWTPLTDQLQSLSIGIGALAVDPANDQIVIVGTGRFSGYANRGDDLVGLYDSTDGGANWTTTTDPQLSAARITGVARVVVSCWQLLRTVCTVRRAVHLAPGRKFPGAAVCPMPRAASIVGDPANSNRFYVTFTGAAGGLFQSDDLGANWSNITGNINVISADTTAFDAAVYNDGATNVVTVLLNGTVNGAAGNAIFRSLNGAAFTALDVPLVFSNAYGKFGLTADKTNSNVVYISGGYVLPGSNPFLASTTRVDASQPSGSQLTLLYSGVSGKSLTALSASQTTVYVDSTTSFLTPTPFVVTVDGEQMTVTSIAHPSWYYTLAVQRGANGTTAAAHALYAPVLSGAAYGAPHVDVNVLATDGAGALLMGTHGSLYNLPNPVSPPSATNTWLSKAGDLGVSEMHDIAYDHVTHTLIGSNQDNCVVFQAGPGSLSWPVGPGYSGDGGDVAVADVGGGQSVRYASNQNLGSFQRLVYDAANNLVSVTTLSTSAVTDKQFTTPIAVNAVDPNRLLIGGSANLYESLNGGDTINKIATAGVYERAIAYGGRRNGVDNPDVLYVASGLDTFYARTTAGAAVVAKTFPPGGAWYARDIVINPEDWMNVFVVDTDSVFASTDGGNTWSDITGNLLSVSSADIRTIEFVEAPSPYIVVGTRSGVFASRLANLGSWSELASTLPDVLVYDLDYDATDNVLAAGTLRAAARGCWLMPPGRLRCPRWPQILALSGPTTADEGATQYTYSFTVDDPGDSFTVNGPTIGGGALVPGSLATTGSGGSFKVTFDDGPSSATIDLQVTDSTGLPSNTASTSVTVVNVKPAVAIIGAPTSGSPGTPVNLSSSVTDPSPTDTIVGFTYYWLVQKYVDNVFVGNFAIGDTANFSYTPDVAGKYNVFFKAQDKDGLWSSWTSKTINAASPDLAMDSFEVRVNEGQTATNSGSFAHKGPAPLTLSASAGAVAAPQTLFADNFDAEPLATSTATLDQWNVVAGNTSVLGPGGSDPLPGNGRYLDLYGTAGAKIESKATFNLAPGAYRLYFRFAQSGGGPNYGVRPGLDPGSYGARTFIPSSAWGLTYLDEVITTPTSVKIVFDNAYGPMTDLVLDEVSLVWMNPGPTAQPVTALNVLGYWQLGEDDAGAADGLTGNDPTLGHDSSGLNPALGLTRSGSPNYTAVDGSNGSVLAMSFNGSDSYTLATPVTTATDNFGIEAWVRPTDVAGSQVIAVNGDANAVSGSGFGMLISGTGGNASYYVQYGGNTLTDSSVATGVAIVPGVWQHIALVRDNGVTKFYLNGALAFSDTPVATPVAAAAGVTIGANTVGDVDDVRIFTFAPGTFDPQDLGINERVSGAWSWGFATTDGPAESGDVTITASTGVSGDSSSLPFQLTVNNRPPIGIVIATSPVNEGSTSTASVNNPIDPSSVDTAAGLHFAFDFDNDGVFEVGDGTYAGSGTETSMTVPAQFLTNGPAIRTIHIRIIDKDDGYVDRTRNITINNVAPTASISGPANALAGQVIAFLLHADDSPADQLAGFTYSVDWGDGSSETVDPVAGSGDAVVRHAYSTAGGYTVQVTATDQDRRDERSCQHGRWCQRFVLVQLAVPD